MGGVAGVSSAVAVSPGTWAGPCRRAPGGPRPRQKRGQPASLRCLFDAHRSHGWARHGHRGLTRSHIILPPNKINGLDVVHTLEFWGSFEFFRARILKVL